MDKNKRSGEDIQSMARDADRLCFKVFNATAAASALFFVLSVFNGQAKNNIEDIQNTVSPPASEQMLPAWKSGAMGAASGLASLLTFGIWARHRREFPQLAQDKKKGGGNDNDNDNNSTLGF